MASVIACDKKCSKKADCAGEQACWCPSLDPNAGSCVDQSDLPGGKCMSRADAIAATRKELTPACTNPTYASSANREGPCLTLARFVKRSDEPGSLLEMDEHLRKGCEHGEWEACGFFGGTASVAIPLWRNGCENNNGRSCSMLARELKSQANELYQKGCKLGDPHGCFSLGGAHEMGTNGLSVDKKRASELYARGCSLVFDDLPLLPDTCPSYSTLCPRLCPRRKSDL